MINSKEVETMKTRLVLSLLGSAVVGTFCLSGNALAQGDVPDYGDLVVLHRDISGVPILDASSCQQPKAFPENVGCPIPVGCDGADPCLIPIDTETCTIPFEYATCSNEADFGRTNLSRASEDVLDFQLDDVLIKLATADCVSLDPAGRMVYGQYAGAQLKMGTIDSPLQNLSVYKHLMRDGTIGVVLPEGASPLQTAARGLGVAMDKAGAVNMDLLVYLNEFLGLTEDTTILGDPTCIDVKQEVMGVMQMVQKCFLNYSTYLYDRTSNFSALPSPAYIPQSDPEDGTFEFLMEIGDNLYKVAVDSIMTTVFQGDPGYTDGNIGGFVQAADDTRAVINYMHNNPVPAAAATPVPCAAIPNPTDQYDLSISSRSGLKVPKQVVSTTEGREFVITVDNGGPDTAAGTLVLTATRADGGQVLVDGAPGPFFFPFDGLLPGMSYTTGPVFFTLSEPHLGTTIDWRAEAIPESMDPNTANNVVVKTSTVRAGGGH
jgi:hypothetical protein